jgi:hypothetical protein
VPLARSAHFDVPEGPRLRDVGDGAQRWSRGEAIVDVQGLSNEDLMYWHLSRMMNLPTFIIVSNSGDGDLTEEILDERLARIDRAMRAWSEEA